jgi:hypothetical protein
MKKPRGESHKPRAHTEGLDEFSKLEQQYDSASIEERDRLHPDFIQAIRKKRPGLVEETWRALRSGDSLKATLRHSMKRVLDRHDLSAGRKTNAREDADAAMWVFDELQRPDLKPNEMRELAFDLATRTLFTGLRAGLSLNEIEELRRQTVRDSALTAAKTPKKEGPRRAHAKKLACEIVKENPEFSYAEIVEAIPNRWRLENVACFTPRWLAELVPQWFPSRPKSARRRTYPLRRHRRF